MLNQLARIGIASNTFAVRRKPLEQRLRRLSGLERREEARAFLRLFYNAADASPGAFTRRWAEVRKSLSRYDHYDHTPEELAFGARLAWRNHARCIGRLFWESLEVVDCRHIIDAEAIAGRVIDHMGEAINDGRIRSVISIFAPVVNGKVPAYIESEQITQYAGYALPDGAVVGDRQNIESTRIAQSLGWNPQESPGHFDLLPFVVRGVDDRRKLFSVPDGIVREVPIRHPDHPALEELDLKWYAVPCVSGMILTIGGIEYPCAPFNGFYMCTEIASRNLADVRRYNLLPKIAQAFGLNPMASTSLLWQDTALTELNRAVLYSYKKAGVTMVDHHAASDQFMDFHRREQAQGRRVAADWRWINPPQASASCPVFHLKMRNFHPVPNYYRSRADDGLQLMPYYGDQYRSRIARGIDRVVRRYKLWKRMPW